MDNQRRGARIALDVIQLIDAGPKSGGRHVLYRTLYILRHQMLLVFQLLSRLSACELLFGVRKLQVIIITRTQGVVQLLSKGHEFG